MNFQIYESFFKTFCKNKNSMSDYKLRADFNSFNEGITYWYGRENEPLAKIMYNYFGYGNSNHTITFS